MMKSKGFSAYTIAATYVGTVVGAGFATGQEVLRFFTHLGVNGVYGVLGATILFAVLGSLILRLGHQVGATSHQGVVDEAVGPVLGRVIDWVITFFLLGGAAVMMAGSGAVFAEHWHLNRFLGTLAMAVLAGGTVALGLRGVVGSIAAIAPVLVAMVLVVTVTTLVTNGLGPHNWAWYQPAAAASRYWPVSMLLYVSYNLLFSTAVLGPLGREVGDVRRLHLGGLVGGTLLGMGTLLINLALLSGLPETAGYEVPMLSLARQLPPWLAVGYSLVLWAEVYTTAVASLYGFAVRLTVPGSTQYLLLVAGAAAGALVLSQVGFATMVGVLFPLVGWLGLILIGGLLWRLLRGYGQRTPLR
jgi:uncharacterized membrane protein YkvI